LREKAQKLSGRTRTPLTEAEPRGENGRSYRSSRAFNSSAKDLENRPLLAMLNDRASCQYAFPEAGVNPSIVLPGDRLPSRSVVPADGRSSEELPTLSYERPAAVAIREPGARMVSFYAHGRR